MTRGRKPMPTKLKILRGETRPSRLNRNEPKPRPEPPTVPAWMDPEHKRTWRKVVGQLDDMGIITKADEPAITVLVVAIVAHRRLAQAVAAVGPLVKGRDGGVVKNPAVAMCRDAAGLVLKVSEQFGLTPSARTRLELPEPDVDEIEEILSGASYQPDPPRTRRRNAGT